MAMNQPKQSLGRLLQSLPRTALFAVLIFATALPLFFSISIPNQPKDEAIDAFTATMAIPEGKTVLVSSDWTNSTRAESKGQFLALIRMLMQRNVKFAVYSISDPQAPQVARDAIAEVNAERLKDGKKAYERWNDWVDVGFFPSGDTMAVTMGSSVKAAWAGRKDINPQGQLEDVFDSPVLKGVTTLSDIPAFYDVTGTPSSTTYIQRIANKVPMILLCTGVMSAEAEPYYTSGQLKGLVAGLKGMYDVENMMVQGVNVPGGKIKSAKNSQVFEGFRDPKKLDMGAQYYPALHVAMLLLILAIAVGNVGMFMTRREAKS